MKSFGINFEKNLSIKTEAGIGRKAVLEIIANDIIKQGFNVEINLDCEMCEEYEPLVKKVASKHNDKYDNIIFGIIDGNINETSNRYLFRKYMSLYDNKYKDVNNIICLYSLSTLAIDDNTNFDYNICFDKKKDNNKKSDDKKDGYDRIIFDLKNKEVVGRLSEKEIKSFI